MELSIKCNKCNTIIPIIQSNYEKNAYKRELKKIDFKKDTSFCLKQNQLTFKCPQCQNQLSLILSDIEKSLYILYTTDVVFNNDVERNITHILEDARKEIYYHNNIHLKKQLQQLDNFDILSLQNQNIDMQITTDTFKNALKILCDSLTEAE